MDGQQTLADFSDLAAFQMVSKMPTSEPTLNDEEWRLLHADSPYTIRANKGYNYD